MEAMESLSQHRDETAREWIPKGLALYPNNLGLLNVSGILAIRENDFALAREIFCRLLERKETKGLHRYLILNNIAYVDALMGTPELLDEAEKYSLEALRGIAWLPNMVGTRGTVLVERGDLEQGIPLLEKAMNDSEDIASKAENACILAIAESRRAKADRARSFLNLAEKLNPQCHLLPRVRQTLGR
jgi:tetratricopeptide (TPR) repeat protein